MNDKKVSIIIPCYNVSEYLEKATESILNQTYRNWEAIFIDDGSKDDTWLQLKKIRKRDSRFKVFQKINEGSGLARNYGLNKAVGNYVYFMDPDDWIEPNLLSENISYFQKYNMELIVFGYKEIKEETNSIKIRNYNQSRLVVVDSKFIKEISNLERDFLLNPPWNKIYDKKFLDKNKVRFTSQKKGQDALFNIEALKYISCYYINTGVYYNYVMGRIGSAQTNYNSKDFQYAINILKSKLVLYKMYGGNPYEVYSNGIVDEIFYDNLKLYKSVSRKEDFIRNKVSLKKFQKVSFSMLTLKNKFKYTLLRLPSLNYKYFMAKERR